MYPLATSSESSTLAPGRPNLAVIMCELTTWLAVVAMHHLRLVTESAVLTEEQMVTSWRRCFDASRGVYNLAKGMLRSEANMTRVWNIRVNPFSVLPAYMLFCLSFPLRFLIGCVSEGCDGPALATDVCSTALGRTCRRLRCRYRRCSKLLGSQRRRSGSR